MHVHSRSARLGYFPAFHLHYVHGEKYTPSRADIVPARYDALIGAADKQPRVCAELHPSPLKSQVCWLALAVKLVRPGRLPSLSPLSPLLAVTCSQQPVAVPMLFLC